MNAPGGSGGVPPEVNTAPILRAAIGLGLYAGAFAMAYGAVAVGSGLSIGQTMVLSLVMFTGASQLAFAGVVAAAANPLAGVPTALLLGVRNAFYGVTMSEILAPRGARRLVTAHFVIDETTAMAVGQSTRADQRYAFWTTGLILFVLWQSGSLAGALLGSAIDPRDLRPRRRRTRRLSRAALACAAADRQPLGRDGRRGDRPRARALCAPRAYRCWPPLQRPWSPGCAGRRRWDRRDGPLGGGDRGLGRVLPAQARWHVPARIGAESSDGAADCAYLPVAMLSALVAVELFDGGGRYAVDWAVLAGFAAGVVALLLKRGLLVVFVVAVAVTALIRLVS